MKTEPIVQSAAAGPAAKLPVFRTALAPMAGVTDHAFRLTCKRFGAGYTCTEMLSAKALHFEDRKTAVLGKIYQSEEPVAVQIFGSDPLIMAEAAEKIAENSYRYCESEILPAAVDLNMGCPAPKVANNGDGSALLRDPALAERIVREVVRACPLPVTVKMRIGWDEASVCGVEFAKRMEDAGASMLAVHGRTREGRFSAPINYDEIRRIREAVRIPVIGNGEIFTADDALRMLERTGCEAVMIGRGALGNPWLFAEIEARLAGKPFTPPTWRERAETALGQLRLCIGEKGEKRAVLESRRQLAWYLKGRNGAESPRGAAYARGQINSAAAYGDVEAIFAAIVEQNPE